MSLFTTMLSLLAVSPVAWTTPQTQQPTALDDLDPAKARTIIVELNRQWGKARVDLDKPTMEKMLAPDFYVQLYDQKMSRKDFIDSISKPSAGGKMTRFDVEVLTVQKRKDHWAAVIVEKIEGEGVGKDGKKHKGYSLWITRDGWKQVDDHWVALYSEAVGNEGWLDVAPPVPRWGP